MSDRSTLDHTSLLLPDSIISKKDLSQLVFESEKIDYTLTSNHVREQAGMNGDLHYESSEQMKEFLTINSISMSEGSERRTEVIKLLRRLKDKAPIIHLTFASEVDHNSLTQIVSWLRSNVEEQTVVSVGLQPGLIGGVHIRTTNQVHDLSLRSQLEKHRDILIKEVEAISGQN